MAFQTLADIRTQILAESDLEAEEFVQPAELLGYIHSAISVCEAHIIKLELRDKYFLKRTKLSIVQGEEDITLPTDIYANKIFKLVYKNGNEIYPIEPIDSEKMYEEIAISEIDGALRKYRYLVRHDVPGTEVIQLVPAARDNLTDVIHAWHYRDANRPEEDTDLIDLPEICYDFILKYCKAKVRDKEKDGQALQAAMVEQKEAEKLMIETLSQQIVDSSLTKVDMDLSWYGEHS